MEQSLYDKYGGFESVGKIVHALYEKISESELLAPYFKNTDMKRLMNHQTQFFSSIMGGPVSYEDGQLEKIHRRLNVTEEAFGEVAELLEEVLEDFEMEEGDIETIMGIVEGAKPQIVQKSEIGKQTGVEP